MQLGGGPMRIAAVLATGSFCLPPVVMGDSHAYVMSSGNQTPGAITPLHTAKGTFGVPYFVLAGGNLIAIAAGAHQVWQATTAPFCDESSAYPSGKSSEDAAEAYGSGEQLD